MANLWRTQRPRFPQYISDGNGRDYYIKYNNAGYWDNQFTIQKKPEYEYPKYNNFHSLFHHPAPVKYIPTGNGRETYIINDGGLHHDEKPLASFKLDDFLRETKSIENPRKLKSRRYYMSLGEKKYNNKLQTLEKQLIKRLYKIPKKLKRDKKSINFENENILPSLEIKKEYENDDNKSINNNIITNNIINNERLNTIESLPSFKSRNNTLNKNRKLNKISLKDNLATILRQSQQIGKYELNNNSRRNNNESSYNIYKNGRLGCRLNELKSLINSQSENFNYRINRMHTEGNQIARNYNISLGNPHKRIRKNKLTFSLGQNSEENRFKTLEY